MDYNDNNSNNDYLPAVIYIASPEEAKNWEWSSESKAVDKNLAIMEIDKIKKIGDRKEHIYLPYDLTPGEVLVRHPYNQGYILATDAEEKYLEESAKGIFLVAQLLGATRISYKKCNIAEFTREFDTNNNINIKPVKIDLEVKKMKEEILRNKITMTREFSPQEFTVEQLKNARKIAKDRGLMESSEIRSMFDARDPNIYGTMKRQTVTVETFSSLNKALDIAFTLNVGSLFKLSSNTKTVTKKKTVLNIEWDIEF